MVNVKVRHFMGNCHPSFRKSNKKRNEEMKMNNRTCKQGESVSAKLISDQKMGGCNFRASLQNVNKTIRPISSRVMNLLDIVSPTMQPQTGWCFQPHLKILARFSLIGSVGTISLHLVIMLNTTSISNYPVDPLGNVR